ncbi:hypothetical protein A2392_02420 [Candidatus Kaiserbacteria bacterium RIFOXYB1_FULL_46_14]|uniref:TVP38/TMEM64 family membrane protein n=1 Tax=Candidatus Kaiserbacteria bacterium RIFOXYB1_FULL_46_14 TaxID=1798531 RepID=A0A1F6FIB5_9BACT|nr:MAG: hypothetical protein A2392_02420 [Candidatus Kaiserbacteria bacterium RIFOXYB1_FULL_46_14]
MNIEVDTQSRNKAEFYSALVWIIAGVSLVIFCVLGLLNTAVPGVAELVAMLSSIDSKYVYVAAFVSIFVEGLYFFGSFFPGSTLIIILTLLSQLSGPVVFVGTILSVFLGWCLASLVNIWLAKTYHFKVARLGENSDYKIEDRLWTTWFPAFRANYEVAQVTAGGNPVKVFWSSVRVKFWASLASAGVLLVVPYFVDINQISNEEGFLSVAAVAVISFGVGFVKMRKYFRRD